MNNAPRVEGTEDLVPPPDDVRTELSFSHVRPWRAKQGDTGVHPDHRQKGLGRRLKATTGLCPLDERPRVEFVETWNAVAADAKLSINRAMGFERVARWQGWIVPLSPAAG